jgi:hypothetical protein
VTHDPSSSITSTRSASRTSRRRWLTTLTSRSSSRTAGTFRGLDEIEELFTGLFAEFSQEHTSVTVDEMIVEGEFGYLLWHGETPDNVYEFCTDTFHIPDGTIQFQTYAGKTEPKG